MASDWLCYFSAMQPVIFLQIWWQYKLPVPSIRVVDPDRWIRNKLASCISIHNSVIRQPDPDPDMDPSLLSKN
jgi:hypothetical protein